MDFPFYDKQINQGGDFEDDKEIALARKYRPDDELVSAVNVALLLRQPLLLTGEPGTGKTQLGFHLSLQCHLKDKESFKSKKPLVFETKSSSTARDLFYTYDAIGRFQAVQIAQLERDLKSTEGRDESAARLAAEDFITYNALGKAILLAQEKANLHGLMSGKTAFTTDDGLNEINDADWRRRSVVIIDEIDKAPRDFPNDILNEIEKMYFRVPELQGRKIQSTDDDFRPIIILTSNSEKNLPDAFLRRCVYFHIKFPDRKRMAEIVGSHLLGAAEKDSAQPPNGRDGLIEGALDLFYEFRAADRKLKKTPATAEFISWLATLRQLSKYREVPLHSLKSPAAVEKLIEPTLGVMIKFEEDFRIAKEIINKWKQETTIS